MARQDSTNQLIISNLRGGLNNTDPLHMLQDDECAEAMNVEFFHSSMGERRLGSEAISLTSSGLTGQTVVVHLSEFFPTQSITAAELWAIAAVPGTSVAVGKRTSGTWSSISPDDAILNAAPSIYNIVAQTLNGKHFFAYPSAVDFLHVWDGTNLRRVGLAQPGAAPTGANEGAGTFSGTRYYRTREVIQVSGITTVRGEPSATLTFAPSGAGAGVTVTKPATVNTRATHWEVEASQDNANFYRIATVLIATTTYNDETALGGYTSFTLSDAIGAYLRPYSAKFLSVDGDRLIYGGHWTDDTKKSAVSWTPVLNDPGVGNEERLPIVDTGGTPIITTLQLDRTENGEITGISSAVNGTFYVFKWSHIYQLSRTQDETRAYEPITLSKVRGAIPGSIVQGMDEFGRGCVYFLDPTFGPSRISLSGIQTIRGLRTTWRRVNTLATKVIARGTYYQDKQQLVWVVAADTNDSPTLGLKLQVTEVRTEGEVCRRGWSLFDGKIATAYSMCTFHEVVSGIPTSLSYSMRAHPFGGYLIADGIMRWDTTTTDNGTAFSARIRTRPFIVGGLLQKWGAMVASLLAAANGNFSLTVKLIRDFGKENSEAITTNLIPDGSENTVIKDLDNLALSSARSIQVEFSDPA